LNILPLISLQFGRQEDAHEFLFNLLLGIERNERISATPSSSLSATLLNKSNSYTGRIFGSSIRSYVTCGDCGTISTRSEAIQDLQLQIHRSESLQAALSEYCKYSRNFSCTTNLIFKYALNNSIGLKL
jgi:ubiquitin carboxyl-terminal hydrolase 36/42